MTRQDSGQSLVVGIAYSNRVNSSSTRLTVGIEGIKFIIRTHQALPDGFGHRSNTVVRLESRIMYRPTCVEHPNT